MANPSLIITAVDQASPAIARVRGQLDELLRSFGGFGAQASKLSVPLLGVSAAIAGIGAAVANALNVTRWVDDLADSGAALGISAENMARYQILAKQAGLEAEALGSAFQTLAKNVEGAKAGEAAQIELFRRLGITVKELKTFTPDETITRVAKAFTQFAGGLDKAALSAEAYGKAGKRITEVNERIASGQEVNTGLTKDFEQRANALTRELDSLEIAWKRYSVTLAGPVVDAMLLVSKTLGLIEKTPEQQRKTLVNQIDLIEQRIKLSAEAVEKAGTRPTDERVLAGRLHNLKELRAQLEAIDEQQERRSARDAPGQTAVPPKIDTAGVEAARKRNEAARVAQLEADKRARADLAKAEDDRFEDQVQFRERQLALDKAYLEKKAQLIFKADEEEREAIERGAEIIAARRNEQIEEVEKRIDNLTQLTESFFLKLTSFKGQDIFKTLAKDMAQSAYRLLILQPMLERTRKLLEDMADSVEFGGKGEGFTGILMKLFGLTGTGASATGAADFSYGMQTRALGGPVSGPTWVGEAGPELFMPRTSGTIVPNNRAGSVGAVSVVNNYSIDSRTDVGTISAMLEMNRTRTLRDVREQLSRRSPNLRV